MNEAQHPYKPPSEPPSLSGPQPVMSREEFEAQDWPICEQFVLTVDDLLKCAPVAALPSRIAIFTTIVLAIVLMFGAYRSGDASSHYKWLIAIIAATMILSVTHPFKFFVRRSLKQQLERMDRDNQEIVYELYPTELRIIGRFEETRQRWDSFTHWEEVDGILKAFRRPSSFQIFWTSRLTPLGARALRTLLDPRKRVDK